MLDRFAAEADRLEAEARSIRGRVTRASSSSQHVMRAEAAALERAARRIPCRECNGTGSLWVEASYPECAEELAEYFAGDPGAEPNPLNLETA